MEQGKFPAVKVGIVAGISGAVTLLVISGLIWFGITAVNDFKTQARARAEQTVSDDFKGKLRAYLKEVKKEHEAASEGWKQFQSQKASTRNAADVLRGAAGDMGELLLEENAITSQLNYEDCVGYSIDPSQTHIYTVAECERQSPVSSLEGIVAEAK